MAPDDHSGARPAGPVVLRIKLRYDDLDAMVQKFASNVGKSGLFLPTKSIQPIGTEVKFELRLANDTPVLVGLGRVKHARPPDAKHPKAAFGMGIELTRVSREGREVIIRMLERRRALGLPDVAIPAPEDLETARRSEVETQPRGETSAVVREAMTQLASAPVSEQLLTAQPASGPIAVAKEPSGGIMAREPSGGIVAREPSGGIVARERPSAPLMTAPRTSSGGIPVAPLAPEKSRPRRPRVQELIEKAAELSAPMIAALPTPELDMHVDLDSVLTRARTLAGGDLEVELATLREAAAAPVEISVEAASAELARQLGGKPIAKRDRSGSARWAPPPAVAELRARTPIVVETPAVQPRGDVEAAEVQPSAVAEEAQQTDVAEEAQQTDVTEEPPLPDFAAKTRAETEGAPSATIAAVVEAAIGASPSLARDDDDAFVPNATTITAVDDPLDSDTVKPRMFGTGNDITTDVSGPSALLIDDDADVLSFERALDAARIHTGVSRPAPAPADDGELEDEYARGDKTQIGGMSVAAYAADYRGIPDQLAAQLDQQLAEAEQEAERELSEGLRGEPAYAGDDDDEEISELDVIAEADEDDADLLGAQGQPEAAYGYDAEPSSYGYSAAPVEPSYTPAVEPSHAPAAEPAYAPAAEPAYAPPPVDDFASRLDLGDDDEEAPPSDDFDRQAAREFDAGVPAHDYDEPAHNEFEPQHDYIEPIRPVLPASNIEPARVPRYRRPSSEFPDPPSSSYTFAENYPQAGLTLPPDDSAAEEFDEPHSYAPPPVAAPARNVGPDPRLLRHGRATTAGTEDLEDALAALDVDLDDLANLDRRRPRRPTPGSTTGPTRLPGLPIERPRGDSAQVPIVKSPTGQVAAIKSPTGQAPVIKSATGQVPITRQPARTSKPPPIPAAARRAPTQQVPVVATPKQRASTDEGVLIDFDDDE